MEVNYEILKSGNLRFIVEFENEEERLEAIATTDTRCGYDWFWEELAEDTTFRILSDKEKAFCGDLYGGDVLTDIDMEVFMKSNAEIIENRTWFYKYYSSEFYVEPLYKYGKVILTCRKNL